MATFFMLGKYSAEGIKDVSADRTKKATSLIKELGGKVKSIHALLGGYDCVIISELPSFDVAMRASLGLNILTGISFQTFPALAVDDFDRMLSQD